MHANGTISLQSPSLKDSGAQRQSSINPSGEVKGLRGVPKHLPTKHLAKGGEALEKGEGHETSRKSSCHAECVFSKGKDSCAQEPGCGGLLAKLSSWVMAPHPTAQLCHCLWLQTCLEMRRQLQDGVLEPSGPHVGDPGPVSLCPLRAWGLIDKGQPQSEGLGKYTKVPGTAWLPDC